MGRAGTSQFHEKAVCHPDHHGIRAVFTGTYCARPAGPRVFRVVVRTCRLAECACACTLPLTRDSLSSIPRVISSLAWRTIGTTWTAGWPFTTVTRGPSRPLPRALDQVSETPCRSCDPCPAQSPSADKAAGHTRAITKTHAHGGSPRTRAARMSSARRTLCVRVAHGEPSAAAAGQPAVQCCSTAEPITKSNYCEYQTSPSMTWHASGLCEKVGPCRRSEQGRR